MFCRSCGNKINDGEKFCRNCGTKVESGNNNVLMDDGLIIKKSNNVNNQNNNLNVEYSQSISSNLNNTTQNVNNNSINNNINNNVNNSNQNNRETLGTVSMIMGIISLFLSFIFNVLIIPFAIIGLILGIVNKAQKGKKISGIVLNIISIFISIVILLLLVLVIKSIDFNSLFSNIEVQYGTSSNSNYVAGRYNCKGINSYSSDYTISLYLNNDKTFVYGPYNDLENNHVKGSYTYVDEHKSNPSGEYKYYMLTLTGNTNDSIADGQVLEQKGSIEAEIGVNNSSFKKQSVVAFVGSGNIYYCSEE